jgi:hypothetical protein
MCVNWNNNGSGDYFTVYYCLLMFVSQINPIHPVSYHLGVSIALSFMVFLLVFLSNRFLYVPGLCCFTGGSCEMAIM